MPAVLEKETDYGCKKCQGRLGVSGGVARCDECGEPADPAHPLAVLAAAPAPPRRELPEPGPIESEATLAGRVLALQAEMKALVARVARLEKELGG